MDEAAIYQGGTRAIRWALVSWAVGTIGLGLGAFVDRRQLYFSYLIAYAFVLSIALGALLFLMICHAMRATWPRAIRRIVEAMVAVFPVLLVLFVPLCFGLDELYPWARPERWPNVIERALLLHRRPYLNVPFFVARAAFYFAVWLAVALALRRWSLRQAEPRATEVDAKLYRTSAALLPAVALTMSFAAFDWLMSLMPVWSSSMFPVYFFAGGFLAAIALIAVGTRLAELEGHLSQISESHYYALGRLLLTFTIFWGYVAFFQFMLIWMGDRPDEVTFYLARTRGAWVVMTVVLVAGQFVIPFCLLLNYRLKRSGALVAAIGVWIAAFHYVDLHWIVAPEARADGFPLHWLDAAALLSVGGIATAAALVSARGRPLLPVHDPKLRDALAYESS